MPKTSLSHLVLLLTCSLVMACGQPDRHDDEEEILVIVDADAGPNVSPDQDEVPLASMDVRCMRKDCSGHGTCQILADQPVCVCRDGFVSRGLECASVAVGDPRILSVSAPTVRLTQGESSTLVMRAEFDGEATALLRYVDPDEPDYTEDLYMFEHDGEGEFTLELSWDGLQELYGGLYFKEELSELFYIYLVDEQGRSTSSPIELRVHCEGSGGAACDGQCVDLSTDREHCGRCHTPTPAGAQCEAGTRQCDDRALVACDEGCVTSDARNCGRCGNACYTGTCEEGGYCSDIEVNESVAWRGLSESVLPSMVDAGRTYRMELLPLHATSRPAEPGKFVFSSRSSLSARWTEEAAPAWPADQEIFRIELLADSRSQALELIYAATTSHDAQGNAITHLYATRRDDVDSPWSPATRISEHPLHIEPGVGRVNLHGIFRTHVDSLGMHWLVHRSQQGFEVLSRSDFAHPWQQFKRISCTFVDSPNAYHFGHVYDAEARAHHLVFRDQAALYHAMVKDSEPVTLEVLETNLHVEKNEISNLYLDQDGVLHVMYGRLDQLAYRAYLKRLRSWTQPELITPASDNTYPIALDPDPESFILDKWGNKWVLTHVGWQTVLFHQPAGTPLWTSRIVGTLLGDPGYYGTQTTLAVGDNLGHPVVHTYHKSIATPQNPSYWIYTRYAY